jgi:peptidyl-prolyl cis-trans isomerase SurA
MCRNTPEEVQLFQKIPAADLPFFWCKMEVAQIVVTPKFQCEISKVIDKLNGFQKEIEEGSSFSTKAVLYSQDPGSRQMEVL